MKKSYCLVVTDHYSRFSWVFFLATKDEISGILKTFVIEIENQLDHNVKVIRNETEFKNSIMNKFCNSKGIKREFSVARTPQQNGVAKRKNRTLIKAARTMLVDSRLPITFWAEAVKTACYVLNRVLITKPHNKTPYEHIRGRSALIDFMKPFGCPVTILNTKDHLGKFNGKADEGYFVGYFVVSKAIRVFNKRTRIVEETLNIRFLKNAPNLKGNGPVWIFDVDTLTKSMNYVPVVAENQSNDIAGIRNNIIAGQVEKEIEPEQKYILIPICTTDSSISQGPKVTVQDARAKHVEVDKSGDSDKDEKDDQDIRISTAGPSSPVNTAELFSPFKHVFQLPNVQNMSPMDDTGIFDGAYDDEDVSLEADLNNLDSTIKVSSIPTTKIHRDHPLKNVIGNLHLAPLTRRQSQQNLEELGLEPKKVIQALADPSWVEAMQDELLQFKLLNIWTLGHTQEEGIDYDEVFALVARIKAIRLFLAYASFKDFVVYQVDVNSAFLYGKIEEEVYVCQPPGFEDPNFPNKVYKVEKALYGLHQAPRAWYETLSSYLLDNGFYRSQIDKTLFIKRDKDDILLVQIYVDDIIFWINQERDEQKDDGIFISQDKYVVEILKKFDFDTIKTTSTLIEVSKPLLKDEESEDVDVHLYRSMIGSLMYLIASRTDRMFVVCACARFQSTPKVSHLHVVKRIFRYLKGQPKLGLWYPKDSPFDLEAFSDSDYAGASIDRKSITGGCQFLGKRLISMQCKKQKIVANSTTEGEYIVATSCCGQVFWIQNQMLDYEFNFMKTKIYIDNESTITIIFSQKLLMLADLTFLLLALDYSISKAKFVKGMIDEVNISTARQKVKIVVLVLNLTRNGHQFTMYNRHQELARPKQTAIGQTTTGKETSNSLMADSLPKTIKLYEPPFSRVNILGVGRTV
ncbi:putative ribonuclease H-like domain-containing protein [Tanacetum coccineum]